MTHPFHPWLGKEIEFNEDGESYGSRRLRYQREDGSIAFFPTKWTDQAGKDPFVEWAHRKAIARPEDLLELSELLRGLSRNHVKENTPQL